MRTKGRKCNMCSNDGLTLAAISLSSLFFYELPLCCEKTGNFVLKIMKRHEIGERTQKQWGRGKEIRRDDSTLAVV